ncbi:hypothetical protein SAMN05444166_4723 [Singulisphaera sp. GP187]|uniref:hypothetical protein n=1 Tax=Singulisphaera sp. GP187 TaxID=1882752 RepID=UPI00092961CD|nr:hypothetical protein [Singulisphaera sp. GP187]SIO43804.1 hypothetical protein SAMN05444166_4723 [Singulisphaera sp. GP187]
MRGPLIVALCGLVLVQLATWIPHYLTWPYWADHDVFATIAQGWDDGLLPYRDLLCNNFPGTIYLFWILGKGFGWGKTLPFYAVDAAMLVALGGILLAWSRRRLGGILPGLVGYLTFLSYYLGLDYAHAGQRDWHGPFFAVVALLTVQSWPGRIGRLVSALAMALAICFRPQTILFVPAMALAIDEATRRPGESAGKTVKALLVWGSAFTLFLAASFLPLVLAGVMSDFIQGVRLTAYGGSYNRVTPASILMGWISLIAPLRMALIPVAIALLALGTDRTNRRLALVWLAAIGFGSLYKPLSPVAHTYLNIPLMLIWAVCLAVLAHLVLALARQSPLLQLTATLLILGLGGTARPEFCVTGPTQRALAAFRQGRWPDEKPPGYRAGTVSTSGFYPWQDYRALIDHLKHRTTPATKVANVLKGDPAVTSPATRHSVFPVESMAWLRMLSPEKQADFAQILAQTPNAVVVWIPSEVGPDPKFKVDQLVAVIRTHFEPDVQFGEIEVWKRKAEPEPKAEAKPQIKTEANRADEASSSFP